MSIPKYMRMDRTESAKAVLDDVEKLVTYMFQITNNQKSFPKAFRYTLTAQIRNCCLKLWRNVYRGCAHRTGRSVDYEEILVCQRKAHRNFMDLKSLMVIASNVANIRNYENMAMLYDSMATSFNIWARSTKRSFRKAQAREQKALEDEKFRRKILEQARNLKRDEEGFAHLEFADGVLPPRVGNG